jgi:uncharacterized membrane protein YfcA
VEAWELAVAFAGAFVAGFLGSVVGLVLGSLRLPAILLASGSPATAAGTNIAVSAVAALSGGLAHARAGRVSWRIVAWMTPPSIVGAFVGGYFGHAVPTGLLYGIIAAVLLWSGLDLIFELRAAPATRRPRLAASVSGGLIGLLGGAVGLILGTLRMPALIRSVGLSPHAAVGTNLVVGFFLGAAGFAGHLVRGEVDWPVLAVGVAGAIPGAWLGARSTGGIEERTLRRLIGVALVVVAVTIAVTAIVR